MTNDGRYRVGIVLEPYKQPWVFRALVAAEYGFEAKRSFMFGREVILVTVVCDDPNKLRPVVEAAIIEARKVRHAH